MISRWTLCKERWQTLSIYAQSAIKHDETKCRNVDKVYIFPNTLNLDQVIAHIYAILTFIFTHNGKSASDPRQTCMLKMLERSAHCWWNGHRFGLAWIGGWFSVMWTGATAQLVRSGDGRRRQGAANPAYPGLTQRRQNAGIKTPARFYFGMASGHLSPDRQLPRVETQFGPDRFEYGLPGKIDPVHRIRLPAGNDGLDLIRSPDAALIDIVARLQLDMEEMKAGSIGHQTLGGRTSPGRPRQVAFTSTKVCRAN